MTATDKNGVCGDWHVRDCSSAILRDKKVHINNTGCHCLLIRKLHKAVFMQLTNSVLFLPSKLEIKSWSICLRAHFK